MNIKLSMKRGMRGTFLFALALTLTLFVAACSKNANTSNSSNSTNSSNSSANTSSSTKPVGSSPTDALKAYYDAAKRKDLDAAKKYLSRGTVQMMEDIAKSQGKTLDQMMKEGADRDSQMPVPEFSNEKIDGDTATVDIKTPNQPLVTAQMVKEDGMWKLAVDKMMGKEAEAHPESGNTSDKGNENENDHH